VAKIKEFPDLCPRLVEVLQADIFGADIVVGDPESFEVL
jgi:hypothetical protein